MKAAPDPKPEPLPFPYSMEERCLELEKKLLWARMEIQDLKRKNTSLSTQLRKFYR